MLKTFTELFVSLLMIAGAAIGFQTDAPGVLARFQAGARHSLQATGYGGGDSAQ